MNKRFSMWAGRGLYNVIWPIVDNKTCGEIKGEPTEEPFYCVAYDHKDQAHICRLLNEAEERESFHE